MKNSKYCKVKDNSLKLEITLVEPTTSIKMLRKIVILKEQLKKMFNLPERTELIKLPKKQGYYFGEKELNKNIVTEIKHYKGKRVITVKTDINNRYLAQI